MNSHNLISMFNRHTIGQPVFDLYNALSDEYSGDELLEKIDSYSDYLPIDSYTLYRRVFCNKIKYQNLRKAADKLKSNIPLKILDNAALNANQTMFENYDETWIDVFNNSIICSLCFSSEYKGFNKSISNWFERKGYKA